MNTNDLLLRALTNLFAQSTLVGIIFTFLFLVIQKRVNKYLIKIGLSERWSMFFSAWLTIILLAVIFLLFQNIALTFREKYYKPEPSLNIEIGLGYFAGEMLIGSISMALGYSIYQSIRKRFIITISNLKKQILLDGLSIFTIAYLTFLCSFIIGLGYDPIVPPNLELVPTPILQNLLISSAYWVSPVLTCTIILVLYNYFEHTSSLKDQQQALKIARLQQELTRSQLDALSSKINPHFLYNALNSIAGLANTDGVKTRNMAIALSKLFRYNLNKEESNYAPIKDELEMVRTYLEIEKIRFDERLKYSIEIAPDLESELIPRHLLQPLVENAVKHGGKPEEINVHISICKENDFIEIKVGDNGKPFDMNINPGYGLKSMYDKLDLLTAGQYEVAFLTAPKTVQIRFRNNFNI